MLESMEMSASKIFENLDSGKMAWPFKNMSVGDVVEFPPEIASMVATSASGYGANYNMKFKRRKDKETGKMYIKRVA